MSHWLPIAIEAMLLESTFQDFLTTHLETIYCSWHADKNKRMILQLMCCEIVFKYCIHTHMHTSFKGECDLVPPNDGELFVL